MMYKIKSKGTQLTVIKMLLHIILAFLIIETYGKSYRILPLFPDHRIVGGQRIDIRSHPHQLSLQTFRHICGASIISEKWAITAGHCVGGFPSTYKLRAGSSNNRNGILYKVARIIRHPQFNRIQIDYDVAVIQLQGKFNLSETVQPIKLAQKQLSPGQMVNITGWGNTEYGANDGFLRQVSVPIVEHKLCEIAYRDINPITPRMICAGMLEEGGKDSCQGDSGGPLTADGTLFGLVSWGLGCAQPRFPGVYTNVAEIRSWIKNTTGV